MTLSCGSPAQPQHLVCFFGSPSASSSTATDVKRGRRSGGCTVPHQHAMASSYIVRPRVFLSALGTLRSYSIDRFFSSPLCSLTSSSGGSEDTSTSYAPSTMDSRGHEIVIALGSNLGNRVAALDQALRMMRRAGIHVISHSGLYESAPAYVTDQPKFLNSAIRAHTLLTPSTLLAVLKDIEKNLGRTPDGIRYGPRPIDLDILFYSDLTITDEKLTVPHPRIWERPFVLAPLMDLYSTKLGSYSQVWKERYQRVKVSWDLMGGDRQLGQEGLKLVMPIGNKLWSWSDRTYLMGILNVTPDSFSDGGKYIAVQDAVAQAEALVAAGADIIDIGAQSTRPFATKLTCEEELQRLVPVLEAIQKVPAMDSVWLSADTYYSKVAKEAVKYGVHIVNDVSGGSIDLDMHKTIAELGVPYVLMHMRGDPTTMQNEENTRYRNVIHEVAEELCIQLEKAESVGIPLWRIVIDPGIGFSKTVEQNVELLRNLSTLRSALATWSVAASKLPILIGPSRKGFLGKICGCKQAEDRDVATIGAVVAGISNGADIVRIHNVKSSIDAIHVADAIFKTKCNTKGLRSL